MLTIRPYTSEDVEPVTRLHIAQGLPYPLPDWDRPEFLVRAVLENGHGPEMALFLRKTAETFLLFDPQQTSLRQTMSRIVAMTKECSKVAKRSGLSDVHAWLAPEIAPKFGRVLEHL